MDKTERDPALVLSFQPGGAGSEHESISKWCAPGSGLYYRIVAVRAHEVAVRGLVGYQLIKKGCYSCTRKPVRS